MTLGQRVDEVESLLRRTEDKGDVKVGHLHRLERLRFIEELHADGGLWHPDLGLEQRVVAHAWALLDELRVKAVLRLRLEAVVHGLERVVQILKDARQADTDGLCDGFSHKERGVHEAIVLDSIKNGVSHRCVDDIGQIVDARVVLLVHYPGLGTEETKAQVDARVSVDVRQDGNLVGALIISADQVILLVAARRVKELLAGVKGCNLVILAGHVGFRQFVQEAVAARQDIEAELDLRLLVDLANIDLPSLYHLNDAPIEPSVAHLNVVAGLVVLHRLQVVDPIDLLAQLVVEILGV